MRIARVKVSSTTSRAVLSGRAARLASCNVSNDVFGDPSLDLTLITSAIGARATTSTASTPASVRVEDVEDSVCIVAGDASRETDRGARAAPKRPRVEHRAHHTRRPIHRAAGDHVMQEAGSR